MAWPQSPQPAPQPAPAADGSTTPPIPALVTALAALLTLLFSAVQIQKPDIGDIDGWSVWTTQPGFFGIGTWIPIFALAAGGLALARALVRGLEERRVAGFGLQQVQLVLVVVAILIWLGYVVNAVLADFVAPGLGALLLFLGLGGVAAGTAMDVLGVSVGGGAPRGAPAPGVGGPWPQGPAGPHQAAPGPADPAAQWPQQQAPAPQAQWQQPAPPPQWQASDPYGPQPAPPQPMPEPTPGGPPPVPEPPGPLDPQPAPPVDPAPAVGGGALVDPGTQVIPGPPPAPPDDPLAPQQGQVPPPPPPT